MQTRTKSVNVGITLVMQFRLFITVIFDCRIWIVVMSDSESTLKPSPLVVRSPDYHNLVSKTTATMGGRER